MKEEPLVPGRSYLLKIGTRTVPATVTGAEAPHRRRDRRRMSRRVRLGLNEIGFCNLATTSADRLRSVR